MRALAVPEPGDIVKIWMPEREDVFRPGPKFRPVLILAVDERDGCAEVQVVYGTSQRTDRRDSGEFVVFPSELPLEKPTKFALAKTYWLPLTPEYFVSNGQQCYVGRLAGKATDRLRFAAKEVGLL
jgi:hypothetical protein